MNLGQTMLSAGALMLLTILVINAHRLVLQSGDAAVAAEARRSASISPSRFSTRSAPRSSTNSLIPPAISQRATSLRRAPWGPGLGSRVTLPDNKTYQSIRKYNDADDYHGYSRNASVGQFSGFLLTVTVTYVSDDNPDLVVGNRTYTKRVQVTVANSAYFKNMTFSAHRFVFG